MIGLKLQHRDKTIIAGIEPGVTTISQHEDSISFGGLDTSENMFVEWYKDNIKEGEKIILSVVQTNVSAKPIHTHSVDDMDSPEFKLQEFRGLENYLKREGIIE